MMNVPNRNYLLPHAGIAILSCTELSLRNKFRTELCPTRWKTSVCVYVVKALEAINSLANFVWTTFRGGRNFQMMVSKFVWSSHWPTHSIKLYELCMNSLIYFFAALYRISSSNWWIPN